MNCIRCNVIHSLFWLYISVNWPNCFFFSLFIMQTPLPHPQTHDSRDLSNSAYIHSIAYCRNAHAYMCVYSLGHPFLLPQDSMNLLSFICMFTRTLMSQQDLWSMNTSVTFSIQNVPFASVQHSDSQRRSKMPCVWHTFMERKPIVLSEVKFFEKLQVYFLSMA